MTNSKTKEQRLVDKWRDLNAEKQQEILDFVDFIWQKSLVDKQLQPPDSYTIEQRVKIWTYWAESHSKNSLGLPDEALRRENIYE